MFIACKLAYVLASLTPVRQVSLIGKSPSYDGLARSSSMLNLGLDTLVYCLDYWVNWVVL